MKAQLNKVIVKVEKEDELLEMTEAPDTARGVITSIGKTADLDAKVGDTAVFSGRAGVPFEHEGVQYLLLTQLEIYLTL